EAIEDRIESEEKAKIEIEESKSKAKSEAENAKSDTDRIYAEDIVNLEAYRSQIADARVLWLSELKAILDRYGLVSQKLDEYEERLKNVDNLSDMELLSLFSKAKDEWRNIVDDAFVVYHMV